MNQLTQKIKDGKMQISEVPIPFPQKGHVLVRNHYSLISVGTEASTVKTARKGYIGKARERPQQVQQVINTLKTQGPTQTYRAIMKKLDAYSSLGYSCAGEIINVTSDINGFRLGDLVACGGLTASHSDVVSVPANLCTKLKPDADLKQAAYNTLGAIAMQGVRQADLRLGETCGIIGLGLLGQLTALLLKASGLRVIGIDVDPAMVNIAANHCLDLSLHREDIGIKDKISQFTGGLGCDGIIITAATNSLDPINFAGAISRKKGCIVVVGAVPTGFDREPYFYKKELQVKMSCSYGPGRYDPEYEDKGIDYPVAYVRWTEKRNMQAFQELIYSRKIDISHLTTHTFKLAETPAAYDMILAKSEPYLGILIEYDTAKTINLENRKVLVKSPTSGLQRSSVLIGFIGAGSYAQSNLLPNIPKKNTLLNGVMTQSSISARSVAERFGFEFCTTDEKDIIENNNINTVFIATRHDSHAHYVLAALKAGKHVFVEKPLCLTEKELSEIVDVYKNCHAIEVSSEHIHQPISELANRPILMVGYNRRFSALIQLIKKELGNGPMAMMYRVNAGAIPKESWIQDPEFGGGRIIGEVCHFVDTLTHLSGSLPVSVYANVMDDSNNFNDTLNIAIGYPNGSIGNISYFSNGDNSLPKERLEVFAHGTVAIIDNFRELTVHSRGKKKKKKLISQDKGQKEEVKQFIESLSKGSGELIPLEEIYSSSLVTFKIIESIRTGEIIRI